MCFLIIRKADAETEANVMPSEALIRAMTDYNEKLVKAGVMLSGEGLHPSAKGKRVRFDKGRPTVVDGPFAETKELVAGFSLFECASMDEAVAWIRQWPKEDGGGNVEIEIRPMLTAEDFGEAFTPELQAREAALRAETAAKA
jgi:hypothetical protein